MRRKYPAPPLVEAVCEFRFDPTSVYDLTVPGLVFEKLQEQFPKRRQAGYLQTTIQKTPEGVRQVVSQLDVSQFFSEDEHRVVQVGRNLLSVNQLKPYPGWETLLPVIQGALAEYCGIAKPKGYQRIGLKYLNRINIPVPQIELEDYFDFYPHLGERLPQQLVEFSTEENP